MKYSRILFAGFILALSLNFGVDVAEAVCAGTASVSGGHTHTLTVSGGPTSTFFVNDNVNDNVSSGSPEGRYMDFSWIAPNGSSAKDSTITLAGGYTDTFTVNSAGDWSINVSECNSTYATLVNSSITFPVVAAPEFSKFGAFLPVFAAGLIYVSMRKKTIKK